MLIRSDINQAEKQIRLLETRNFRLTCIRDCFLEVNGSMNIFSGQKELHTACLDADLKLTFSPLSGQGLSVSSVSCGLEHVVFVANTGQVFSFGSGRYYISFKHCTYCIKLLTLSRLCAS